MNEKPYLTTTEGEPILCQCDHMWHCFNFDPASTNRSIAQRNLSGTCQNTANSKIFDLDSMAESSAICISCEQDDHRRQNSTHLLKTDVLVWGRCPDDAACNIDQSGRHELKHPKKGGR